MNKIFKSTVFLLILISLFSCREDETSSIYVVPLSEQAPIDDAAIIEFLTNHYFNEEEFVSVASNFNYDIKFYLDEVKAGEDANGDGDMLDTNQIVGSFTRTPLIDFVGNVVNGMTIETKTISVSDVDHTLYILKAVQGLGAEKPKFCDEALLSYVGMDLNKEIFDNALNPVALDLSSTVKGFSESVSEFNIATNAVSNGDGTITYTDYGVGAVFMPSGLGYYATPPSSIGYYAPLIFKLKVYNEKELDHDGDNIPTYVEDLDGDHDLRNDNTDGDNYVNYIDVNDDGDPIVTSEESVSNTYVFDLGDDPILGANEYEVSRVVDETQNPDEVTLTTATYIDTDGDGVLDYLDADS